jgi:ubiquinone/menaquinone biosynthesis C-methylase UbiE
MCRPFARDLVARAAPQPGERVLDVGTGTGVVARLVAPLVGATGSVTGLEPSVPMLAIARERADAEGVEIAWRQGDAVALPFEDDALDLVTCRQVVPFVPDKHAAVREMRRVLAPSGRAMISARSPSRQVRLKRRSTGL